MGVFIQIMQLVLSLSILVLFHEFGHFAFAKLFKTRVEKFYLFFNPWFSLFKFKKGETEYGVGWVPLGGYVKISGMIDESMDKEQMKQPPQPWEFRSKPAWQRLLIMIGGVLVNFILAGLIYIFVLFVWGEDYVPTKNLKYGVTVDSIGEQIGFRDGDKIISVNGKEIERFNDVMAELTLDQGGKILVERDGIKKEIVINDISNIISNRKRILGVRFPFVVDSVISGGGAEKAGLKKGDKFIKVNNNDYLYYDQYNEFFNSNRNTTVALTFLRNSDTIQTPIKIDEEGKIKVYADELSGIEKQHLDYGFFESIPAGLVKGWNETGKYLKSLALIFNPETGAHKSVGSLGTITTMFPKEWNWHAFWILTAILSIVLGVMNLLPIPALDGGHVVFVLYEMITGRKPKEKVLEIAQIVGLVLLLAIFAYAIFNDIINLT